MFETFTADYAKPKLQPLRSLRFSVKGNPFIIKIYTKKLNFEIALTARQDRKNLHNMLCQFISFETVLSTMGTRKRIYRAIPRVQHIRFG